MESQQKSLEGVPGAINERISNGIFVKILVEFFNLEALARLATTAITTLMRSTKTLFQRVVQNTGARSLEGYRIPGEISKGIHDGTPKGFLENSTKITEGVSEIISGKIPESMLSEKRKTNKEIAGKTSERIPKSPSGGIPKECRKESNEKSLNLYRENSIKD